MNCPQCQTPMPRAGNRQHFHCLHCNEFHFPEETGDGVSVLGEPTGAVCPTCGVSLQSAQIEGEIVCYCDHCRGFLTQIATFGIIVGKRRAKHGPHEQISDPFDPAELRRVLKCPNCQQRMDTHPYFGGGNAVVDSCETCGLIWLDAGELAVIERYVPHVAPIERAFLFGAD